MKSSALKRKLPAKERILLAAHRLFNQHGAYRTGVDKIISESGVAKMSFYTHFPSKQDLLLEYFRQKDFEWFELLSRHTLRGQSAKEKILRLFEALEEWFLQDTFNGCPFIRGLAECDQQTEPEIYACLMEHFEKTQFILAELCAELESINSPALTNKLNMLMMGAIIAAQTSQAAEPAMQAREVVEGLLSKP